MFPDATIHFATLIFTLSIIAIIYTSLIALAQTDMKKLIAYSSIAHMGFVTAGTFTLTTQGIEGAIYQMLSHGIVSAALFLLVGVVYDRIHSREISDYGGLVYRMPAYSLVFMLFMLASIGLPGTGGFVGEILVLVGLFKVSPWLAAFAATGIILGAAYMLYLYRRIIFGPLTKEALMKIKDLNAREWMIFAPLIILTLWMGVYPSSFLDFMHVSVENLINQIETALSAQGQSLLARH
jgi:NADH-quinone oxidoreductase subunit M